MYQEPTHKIGQIFNLEGLGQDPLPIFKVSEVNEEGQATALTVLSERPFGGDNGLADIALGNTGGRSAHFTTSGDTSAITLVYGDHPYKKDHE